MALFTDSLDTVYYVTAHDDSGNVIISVIRDTMQKVTSFMARCAERSDTPVKSYTIEQMNEDAANMRHQEYVSLGANRVII